MICAMHASWHIGIIGACSCCLSVYPASCQWLLQLLQPGRVPFPAGFFSKAAFVSFAALMSTLLLPKPTLLWTPWTCSFIMRSWQEYFDFSWTLEEGLASRDQQVIFADFPHGVTPPPVAYGVACMVQHQSESSLGAAAAACMSAPVTAQLVAASGAVTRTLLRRSVPAGTYSRGRPLCNLLSRPQGTCQHPWCLHSSLSPSFSKPACMPLDPQCSVGICIGSIRGVHAAWIQAPHDMDRSRAGLPPEPCQAPRQGQRGGDRGGDR